MKRNDLKNVLKPLIKECIKEVIFEEGVLSGLISEVMKGTATSAKLVKKEESTKLNEQKQIDDRVTQNKLRERKNQMREAVGQGAYNGIDLFEGTDPMRNAGSSGQASSPLETYAPNDPGVDIGSLFSPNWKNLV